MKPTIFAITLLLAISTTSCFMENSGFGIRGEGPIVERKVTLDPVKGISIPGSARVFLTQGSEQEVRLVGQENVIDNIKLDVRGEVWQIGNKRPVWQSEQVKVYMTIETLRLISVSGSGTVEMVSKFNDLRDLEITISGSGRMNLDLDARNIEAQISGSGDVMLKGSASVLDFGISGSGSILASQLRSQKAHTRISGSGNMEIQVEDRLDAHISGSGSVLYDGNPKVDTSISGSGRVRSRQ